MPSDRPLEYQTPSELRTIGFDRKRGGLSITREPPGFWNRRWIGASALCAIAVALTATLSYFANSVPSVNPHVLRFAGFTLCCVACGYILVRTLEECWRRVTFSASEEGIRLTSSGPLGERVKQWPRDQITDVRPRFDHVGEHGNAMAIVIVGPSGREDSVLNELTENEKWLAIQDLRHALKLPPLAVARGHLDQGLEPHH